MIEIMTVGKNLPGSETDSNIMLISLFDIIHTPTDEMIANSSTKPKSELNYISSASWSTQNA